MLFQDAILEFGFDCKVRKLSPKSITNYQKQLRYLQNYLEQEYRIKSVEQVRTAHIKMFLAMMDDKHRKPRYYDALKMEKQDEFEAFKIAYPCEVKTIKTY